MDGDGDDAGSSRTWTPAQPRHEPRNDSEATERSVWAIGARSPGGTRRISTGADATAAGDLHVWAAARGEQDKGTETRRGPTQEDEEEERRYLTSALATRAAAGQRDEGTEPPATENGAGIGADGRYPGRGQDEQGRGGGNCINLSWNRWVEAHLAAKHLQLHDN